MFQTTSCHIGTKYLVAFSSILLTSSYWVPNFVSPVWSTGGEMIVEVAMEFFIYSSCLSYSPGVSPERMSMGLRFTPKAHTQTDWLGLSLAGRWGLSCHAEGLGVSMWVSVYVCVHVHARVPSRDRKNLPEMCSHPQTNLVPETLACTYSPIASRTQGVKNKTALETETQFSMAIY